MTSFACSPGNASHATAAGTLLLALGLLTLSFLRNEGKEYTRDGLAQNATRALVRRDLWISGGYVRSLIYCSDKNRVYPHAFPPE